MSDLDELRETLRVFAQSIVDKGKAETIERGIAGATRERARATVAEELLALLDKLPAPTPLTSPERIPPHVLLALVEYRDHGLRPDNFLHAVLAGELYGAVAHAMADRDEPALRAIPAIVTWIKRELPDAAWGSYAYVDGWTRRARS